MELPYWTLDPKQLFEKLDTSMEGLTAEEAAKRHSLYKPYSPSKRKLYRAFGLLLSQLASPFILLLFVCGLFLFFCGEKIDAAIITGIILLSSCLGFWQEWQAASVVDTLLAIIRVKSHVIRKGVKQEVASDGVVFGDIIFLEAGDLIPGDGRILELQDLFVDEAVLTGETFPGEKIVGNLPLDTPVSQRKNCVFAGTHVITGSARVLVVDCNSDSLFGKTTQKLALKQPKSEFEIEVAQLGYFLLKLTALLVFITFCLNIYFERSFFDSLIFSLTLAVGLTPQLLPTIVSINLARGAKKMSKKGTIIRKLSAIANFGSMNLLCSDKTGTLTESEMRVYAHVDSNGVENQKIALFAFLNASFQTNYSNPIDRAITGQFEFSTESWKKEYEIPYDFIRKRLSVCVSKENEALIITKGAVAQVLDICTVAECANGQQVELATIREAIQERFESYSLEGYRVIAVAYRPLVSSVMVAQTAEQKMVFLGLLVLESPLKHSVIEMVGQLKEYGVELKIITGDNRFVAMNVAKRVISPHVKLLTGQELSKISDRALLHKVRHVDIFAEIEPDQKERLVLALRKTGYVVGYLGDGINDLTAMHASDVSISVDQGIDAVKDSANVILLDKDLGVLLEGIKMGRTAFVNTRKYLLMAVSANFGNVFSIAGACTLLNFLPLLPKQMLLGNLLTDIAQIPTAVDAVDVEELKIPQKWDIKFIRKFMLIFGGISSLYDCITFAVLIFILDASQMTFRSGWFLESVISAVVVIFVIRTRRSFYKSPVCWSLVGAAAAVVALAFVFPESRLNQYFGFSEIPKKFFPILALILAAYLTTVEIAKRFLYRKRLK